MPSPGVVGHFVDVPLSLLDTIARVGPRKAIGSSDFHGFGRLGMCRTFVFARDASAAAILEAIRAKRTVVYGREGKAYGDPELIRLAAADGRLPMAARPDYSPSLLDRVSQLLGVAGIVWLIALDRRRPD
jgi:PHP-associated